MLSLYTELAEAYQQQEQETKHKPNLKAIERLKRRVFIRTQGAENK